MAEPIKMRIREGCRGGQEQFRWNQVKDQDFKDREQYLGQSSKVGMMGKFGRYYLHDWYARKRDTPESIDSELGAVKAYEDELMQEALGLKPKNLLLAKKQLDEEELKEFLAVKKPEGKRGMAQMGPQQKLVTNDFGEQVVEDDSVGKAYLETGIKGLGYASHRTAKLEEYKAKTFGTSSKLEGCKEQGLIKVDEDDTIRFGFGQIKNEPGSSSKSGVKEEVKTEVKEELKHEVKNEDAEEQRGAKRPRESGEPKEELNEEHQGDDDGDDARRRLKAAEKAAKEDKKRKKVEKKQKKAEKKAKKAAKVAKKALKKAKKAKKKCSSSSSSSSS